MTIWEIVILMVVGTICISGGIGLAYNYIVNAVEGYQIRKSKREMDLFVKIMEVIPKMLVDTFEMISKKEREENEKFVKSMNERFKATEEDK